MSANREKFYSEQRWERWLDRIRDKNIDPEEEDSARLLLNLQDDVAVAVAKIVTDYDDGELDAEQALEELERVREIVLAEVDFADEEKLMVVDGVQTSLVCVFFAAEEYVAGGVSEASIADLIEAAIEAEAEENIDAALGYCARAGTRTIADKEELTMEVVDSLEFGLVAEWVNGLDSLQTALTDSEVIDREKDASSSESDSSRDRKNTHRQSSNNDSKIGEGDLPIPKANPHISDLTVKYDDIIEQDRIGSGGNADVIKAILPTADREYPLAIKKPRMNGTLRTDAVERLLEEAETWDKLADHDHIVDVVDYGSSPIPWIAMEYMDGGHLGERSGQMDNPQTLWSAIAITRGVRHAHRQGIVHLDLKPENVLFRSTDGEWDIPKIADWGLSKHLLNHSNSVEGLSPQYAAPEQFTDEYGPVDEITDIYQLGAVFYEMFTGQPPFEGDPAKTMHQVLNESPAPPSNIADVPNGLDEILLKALTKEKNERYEDIIFLRNSLQRLSKQND